MHATNAFRVEPHLRVVPSPTPWLRGFDDLPREHGFEPLRVEGRLPEQLVGTLFRNGPGLLSSFGRRYGHWFDGDGAISAVRFAGGRAEGAVRVVETRGLLEERRRGKRLYGGYSTRSPSPIREHVFGERKNPANTHVMSWNGRLYALCPGGLPTEIGANDLETVGEADLDGALSGEFSAHPHRVAAREATYNFGQRFGKQTWLDLYELADEGEAHCFASIRLAAPALIHDFVATEKYLVFIIPPVRFRMLRTMLGFGALGDNLSWRPSEGTEVLVVPIDDPAAMVRFKVDPFFQWHFCNGFDRAGEIVIDVARFPDFEPSARWFKSLPTGEVQGEMNASFYRLVIDPIEKKLRAEPRWSRPCELPRVAPMAENRPYRWAYLVGHSSAEESKRGMVDRLLKLDVKSGAAVELSLAREGREGRHAAYPSEPIFVPRDGSSVEDAGWVLSLVYDASSHTSHVAVIDAQRFDAGPVARVHFDHHIPFPFHGSWVGG